MGRMNVLVCCALLGSAGSLAVPFAAGAVRRAAALYSGARLIVGDGGVDRRRRVPGPGRADRGDRTARARSTRRPAPPASI